MTGRSVLRILDAAINRGREALRVLEDAARFLADDAQATESLKRFRHDFAALSNRVPLADRLESRATDADVGTEIVGRDEYARTSLEKILTANFCRLQESLRSLEEFAKFEIPELAPGFERLRYRSYTLQKEIFTAFDLVAKTDEPLAERTKSTEETS